MVTTIASTKNFSHGKASKSNNFSVSKILIRTKATFTKLLSNNIVANKCLGRSKIDKIIFDATVLSSRKSSTSLSRCEKNAFSDPAQIAAINKHSNMINIYTVICGASAMVTVFTMLININ